MELENASAVEWESQEDLAEAPLPQKPEIVLHLSDDRMELSLELRNGDRPESLMLLPEYDEIMAAIQELGVVRGVMEERIRRVCARPIYNKRLTVAMGMQPTTGMDGALHYLIDTKREMKPKEREDGTMDYRNLDFIQNVRKGQPLCQIIPPQKGKDGYDLLGNVLEGEYGREAVGPAGRNTEYNEEHDTLISSCDGSVQVIANVVHVSDVLRLAGNVDNSTGNIDFVGDIFVDGDILTGFTVTSEGSVTVKGSVEGATIVAQGSIIVGEGINGMNKGSLTAGEDVRCRFIQSCFIKTEGNIYADSIMYCMIECEGDVELTGRRATLIGGRANISGGLNVKAIGTASHVATYINLCANMVLQQEVSDLEQQLKQIDKDTAKLLQILARFEDLHKQGRLTADQAPQIEQVRDSYVQLRRSHQKITVQLEQLREEQLRESALRSYINCSGRIHAGTQISFGPVAMMVQQSLTFCRISLVNGEIQVTPLGGHARGNTES